MGTVIAELNKEEVNEIERCFERLNSLRELSLTFETDDVFDKKSKIYYKMVEDVTETRKKFNCWWERIIEKYELQEYQRENMRVDFLNCEITIKEG